MNRDQKKIPQTYRWWETHGFCQESCQTGTSLGCELQSQNTCTHSKLSLMDCLCSIWYPDKICVGLPNTCGGCSYCDSTTEGTVFRNCADLRLSGWQTLLINRWQLSNLPMSQRECFNATIEHQVCRGLGVHNWSQLLIHRFMQGLF